MYSEPCAKLTTRVTPKISVSPAETRHSAEADASPLRSWIASEAAVTPSGRLPRRHGHSRTGTSRASRSLRRSHLAHRLVVGHVVLAVGVFPIDHHTLAILDRGAADVRAHRRLRIDRAKGHL